MSAVSAAKDRFRFVTAEAETLAAAAPVLALENVSKRYETGNRPFPAVNGVSLEVGPGRLTALMGPSGSGKTTLLSMMGGILRPNESSVAICGQEISRLGEAERSRVRLAHVGFVFQSYNLFPTLTAAQNVEIVLELKGVHRMARREKALRLLEHMELAEKADAYPADLSGGQKQRVAIARALAGAPKLLLADEPTAALDSTTGRRIMKLFRDLARSENCAVVVVTHDTRIIEFADRVMTIEDGRIVADQSDHPPAPQLSPSTPTMIQPSNRMRPSTP